MDDRRTDGDEKGSTRLNRFLARAGGPSRRTADKEIEAGNVSVNGRVVTELGMQVDPLRDTVCWNGQTMVLPSSTVVLALNKPRGYECTNKPRPKYPSATSLVPAERFKGLVNVGRLDVQTTGLLLFTNDGDLCHKLTAPRFEVEKTYEAVVVGHVKRREVDLLASGTLRLRPKSPSVYTAAPAIVQVIEQRRDTAVLHMTVHEGHYHEVRDLCKAVGHPVRELKRISFGPIELGELSEGVWREIQGDQLGALYATIRESMLE